MSVLTKLFVVLLVVCALLLTAATTVFVNRVEDYRKTNSDLQQALDNAYHDRDTVKVEADAANAKYLSLDARMNAELKRLNDEVQKGTQQAGTLQTQIADLKAQLNTALAANTTQSQAIKALEAQVNARTDQYKAAVAELDQARVRMAELNAANTDFEKRLAEANSELRFQREQTIQLQADKNRLRAMLVQANINPDSNAVTPTQTPPNLTVTVNSVRQQDGQTYATISAGSNDRVQKGMKFTIVDPGSQTFIGNLVIEQVDANESWGRLEGPKVDQAKKGDRALSKL